MEISRINTNGSTNQLETNIVVDKVGKSDGLNKNEAGEKKETKVDEKELKSAVDKANKVLFKNNTHLQFEIHEKTKDIMVKIIKDDTGEVLKEIPPEKFLDMVAKIWEIAGIFVDEKR
jgi:flagellar protein FlaG